MEQSLTQSKSNKIEISPEESALLSGDLGKLTPDQRSSLYMKVCSSLGLNPLTQPFSYIVLNGKLQMYASKNCTDQLRQLHHVSLKISSRVRMDDLYVVNAFATTSTGRTDESTGAVTVGHLKGDALANALMKAETKAKRRVTLSICGLSMLDESEIETIAGAKIVNEIPKLAEAPERDDPPAALDPEFKKVTPPVVKAPPVKEESFEDKMQRLKKEYPPKPIKNYAPKKASLPYADDDAPFPDAP